MQDKKYYYEIDILRGIACLLVYFSHFPIYRIFGGAEYWNVFSGTAGVYLFFIISGFIISKTFDATKFVKIDSFNFNNWYNAFLDNREQIFSFWYRRFLRLFPALSLLMSYAFIGVLVLGLRNHEALNAIINYLRTIATLFTFVNPFEYPNSGVKYYIVATGLGVTWSLLYEVLFYLMFPCIVIFKSYTNILFLFLIFIFVTTNQYFFPYAAFSIGIIIGVFHERVTINKKLTSLFTVIALYVLIISDLHPDISGKYTNTYIISSAFLVYVATLRKNILNVFVFGKVLNFIGVRSYFIYLMHHAVNYTISAPIRHFFTMLAKYIPKLHILLLKDSLTLYHIRHVLALVIVIILADLFYRFIERPFIAKYRNKTFKDIFSIKYSK